MYKRQLYHNQPVKIDIAGTVESIAEITAEKLYQCYRAYYNLHNMVLCVAGNVDVYKRQVWGKAAFSALIFGFIGFFNLLSL